MSEKTKQLKEMLFNQKKNAIEQEKPAEELG